jgi:hypothetical protein
MAAGCRGARGAVFRAAAREGWRRSNCPSATGAKAAPGKIVLTVKLLYVVSVRVFNTKHSSSGGSAQVFFAPQEASAKPTRKQRANGGFANDHRSLHRVSTVLSTTCVALAKTDERARGRCSFATLAVSSSRCNWRFEETRGLAKTRGSGTADIGTEANCSAPRSRRTMTGTIVADCACRSTRTHDAALRRQPVVPLR